MQAHHSPAARHMKGHLDMEGQMLMTVADLTFEPDLCTGATVAQAHVN